MSELISIVINAESDVGAVHEHLVDDTLSIRSEFIDILPLWTGYVMPASMCVIVHAHSFVYYRTRMYINIEKVQVNH